MPLERLKHTADNCGALLVLIIIAILLGCKGVVHMPWRESMCKDPAWAHARCKDWPNPRCGDELHSRSCLSGLMWLAARSCKLRGATIALSRSRYIRKILLSKSHQDESGCEQRSACTPLQRILPIFPFKPSFIPLIIMLIF